METISIKDSIKKIAKDRAFFSLSTAVAVSGLLYSLFATLSLQVRDVQVYTRYTAFGEAHFYKNPWQYLILLSLFGLLVTAIHLILMIKFYNLNRRGAAVFIGYSSLIIILIAAMYTMFIMRLAFS